VEEEQRNFNYLHQGIRVYKAYKRRMERMRSCQNSCKEGLLKDATEKNTCTIIN